MAIVIKQSKFIQLILALLFSAFLVVIGYGLAMRKAESVRTERNSIVSLSNSQTSSDVVISPLHNSYEELAASVAGTTSSANAGGVRRNPRDIAVVDGWFKQSGFSTEGEKSYDRQYTDEQLKELVNKGDTTAIDTLMGRYIRRGESEQIMPLSEKGIIYGSFNSIQTAIHHYASIPNEEDSLEVRQQNKERLKQYLSYTGLMKLRGVADVYATHIDEKLN